MFLSKALRAINQPCPIRPDQPSRADVYKALTESVDLKCDSQTCGEPGGVPSGKQPKLGMVRARGLPAHPYMPIH